MSRKLGKNGPEVSDLGGDRYPASLAALVGK